jgi:pantetheine-phosphate adenylyltransferase
MTKNSSNINDTNDEKKANKRICLFPGSFDPITKGHLDVIERAAKIFDKVVVAVMVNPRKQGLFKVHERLMLIERCITHLTNVTVAFYEGGLLEYAKMVGAGVILRGIRNEQDFAYERDWAIINRMEAGDIEIMMLISSPEHAFTTASHVKEIAALGYDISSYIPEPIIGDVISKTGGHNI